MAQELLCYLQCGAAEWGRQPHLLTCPSKSALSNVFPLAGTLCTVWKWLPLLALIQLKGRPGRVQAGETETTLVTLMEKKSYKES